MLSYDEALMSILKTVSPLEPIKRRLLDCRDLVLSEDIVAGFPVPPFANSAMDGYAVRSADTAAARVDSPMLLPVLAEIAAGATEIPFLDAAGAISITTGAPLPSGADAVIPIEDTMVRYDHILVHKPVDTGAYVRPAGDDLRVGQTLIGRGRRIRPAVAALCAAAGRAEVLVHPRPRAAIVTTGDELIEPGEPVSRYRIYNANSFGLAMQTEEAGACAALRIHARDTPEDLKSALDSCADVDLIITSGGVSVGRHDYIREVASKSGELSFWHAAIRPGKPFAVGRYGSRLLFALPGNPVSTFVTFELFVRPAIRAMLGYEDVSRPAVAARLLETTRHDPGRRSFQRAVVSRTEDGYCAQPLARQGSHQLSALSEANALIVIPEDVTEVAAGETVNAMLLDS